MRKTTMGVAMVFAALIGLGGIAQAQTPDLTGIKMPSKEEISKMPVPELADIPGALGLPVDVPNAKELPDPTLIYQDVFDLPTAAKTPSDVNPGLLTVGLFVNTLTKYGVPADHRKFVVVFHRGSTDAILNNDAYKAKHNVDNPNIKIMNSLAKAGVLFKVCGQSVVFGHIDPKTIQPIVEVDLWAGTTILNLTARGYVHLGGES
jgi:intracellular sulfur oxidation DsrE/DsrF family protein